MRLGCWGKITRAGARNAPLLKGTRTGCCTAVLAKLARRGFAQEGQVENKSRGGSEKPNCRVSVVGREDFYEQCRVSGRDAGSWAEFVPGEPQGREDERWLGERREMSFRSPFARKVL